MRRSRRVALVLLCAALTAYAWVRRLSLIAGVLSWAAGVDLAFSGIDVGWVAPTAAASDRTLRRPANVLRITLDQLLVYSPSDSMWASGRTLVANVSTVDLRLRHCGGAFRPRFNASASIAGLVLHFIAFDPLFADTNMKRLVLALGGDVAAAEGYLDPSAAAEYVSTVSFEHVRLSQVSIAPQIRQGSHRVVLPPITLLDETLDVVMLEAGLSVALLNYASALVRSAARRHQNQPSELRAALHGLTQARRRR